MNWSVQATAQVSKLAAALEEAEVAVAAAEDEEGPQPPTDQVSEAIAGAVALAQKLAKASDEVLVSIAGHLAVGEGFLPGHLSVTISRVDSEGIARQKAEQEAIRQELEERQAAAAEAP